jgi:hypothetical protein
MPGKQSRWIWLALVAPGLVLSVGGAALLGYEALHLGPFANPAVIESYSFGSESMVGAGGWRYQSRTTYVIAAAMEGICFAAVAGVLTWAMLRHRRLWVIGCYAWLGVVMLESMWPLLQMAWGNR